MNDKRQWWIEKALDEIHPIIEMAQELMSDAGQDNLSVKSAHFISSAIQDHARTARRYLSYAARYKGQAK